MQFLIDSGASLSLLPARDVDMKNLRHDFKLRAANGSHIDTFGERFLYIDIGFGEHLPWVFTLAKVSQPILGIDFLKFHNISIHLRNRQLTYNPSNRTIVANCTEKPSAFPIISNIDTLPPSIENLLNDFPDIVNEPSYPSQI